MVILCLCSFTALRTLSAEPPINKKRTRTLFHKESGSSTNCMVEQSTIQNLFFVERRNFETSNHYYAFQTVMR